MKIYQSFLKGKPPYNDYNIQNGLLMFKDKIVLPSDSALLNQIMQKFHSTKIGGHIGVNKTIARIRPQFY